MSTISLSQYHKQTGISKGSISNTLNRLNLPTDKGLTPNMVEVLNREFADKIADNQVLNNEEINGTVTSLAAYTPQPISLTTTDTTADYVELSPIEVLDVELDFITADQTAQEIELSNQLLAAQQQQASIEAQLKQARLQARLRAAVKEEQEAFRQEQAVRARTRTKISVASAQAEGLIQNPKSEG